MIPRQFIVDKGECGKCSDSRELFEHSKSHNFNGTTNRLLKLKQVQSSSGKEKRHVCPRTVIPKRPILTSGERTKLLRFSHLEDPRKTIADASPINVSNIDDLEKVELIKRKENRKGSFSSDGTQYTSGHIVLQPITGSHQDRMFIQNIKSNHILYNNSSTIDEKRIKYREEYTSFPNFDSSCNNMDIAHKCPNANIETLN